MAMALSDQARACPALAITHCVLIGEDGGIRLATVDAAGIMHAVTLTREQAEALAGMLPSVLDAVDPEAMSLF